MDAIKAKIRLYSGDTGLKLTEEEIDYFVKLTIHMKNGLKDISESRIIDWILTNYPSSLMFPLKGDSNEK